MGEVSNGLSNSWQMRSDVPPPRPSQLLKNDKKRPYKRSELARLPSGVHPLDSGQTGRQWLCLLFPKEKDLGCRAESRYVSMKRQGVPPKNQNTHLASE